MTLTELLNSDVTTLGQEARRLFGWWIDELEKLVPARVRRWNDAGLETIRFTDAGELEATDGARNGTRKCIVTIARDTALVREIVTPPMTNAELTRMVALNSERYLPLPGDSVLLSTAVRQGPQIDGKVMADIAALPLPHVRSLAFALSASDIVPDSVRIADDTGRIDPRFDFLPAMRNAGFIEKADSRPRMWWVLLGALAVLNVATMVWRDNADVERIQALVDGQKPALFVAQRMTGQMRSLNAIARRATDRRGQSDPLALLGATTLAVPDGAWVQRFAWNGSTLRLTGYRSRDADVAAALRRMPGISTVKSAQTDTMTEIAAGQPFDLVATMQRR